MIKSYKDLIVYQKSYQLCLEIYEETKLFPKEELYGLVSQLRRAAVSIPSNIAEGYRRNSTKEYIQFLHISLGSTAELETQISISKDLCYLNQEKYYNLIKIIDEITNMLVKLIKKLQEKVGNK